MTPDLTYKPEQIGKIWSTDFDLTLHHSHKAPNNHRAAFPPPQHTRTNLFFKSPTVMDVLLGYSRRAGLVLAAM